MAESFQLLPEECVLTLHTVICAST
uniref:Uncharacterized protein n=1 Tax=Anguilla anguilla TaxID=7936 RepID=A0A0E9VQ97_ANGAN